MGSNSYWNMGEKYSGHHTFEQNLYETKQVSMAPKLKLSESSEAIMLLRKKFFNKQVLPTDNPKDVCESDPISRVHKLDNFPTKFNPLMAGKLEMEVGIEPRCSANDDEPRKIRKISVATDGKCLQEAENSTKKTDVCFVPLHLLSNWIEPESTTRRLTVALLLPSDFTPGKFLVRVSEDGLFLELTVFWPKLLIDLSICIGND